MTTVNHCGRGRMPRVCKTCALYSLEDVLSANGRILPKRVAKCNWGNDIKYPASMPPFRRGISPYFMSPNDGANCECWTPRMVLMPRGHFSSAKMSIDEAAPATPDAGQNNEINRAEAQRMEP